MYKPKFITRDTWNHIRSTTSKVSWHKALWFNQATPKFRFCTWLALGNRLTTGDRMAAWNVGIDGSCVLCNQHLETRDHLFFSCSYTSMVWRKLVQNLYRAHFSTDWSTIVEFLSQSGDDRETLFLARYAFQAAIHMLWRERNARKHGEAPSSQGTIIKFIDKAVRNRLMSLRRDHDARALRGAYQTWIGAVQA